MHKFDVLCRLIPLVRADEPTQVLPPTILEVYALTPWEALETANYARPHVLGFSGYKLEPLGVYEASPEARWEPGPESKGHA